MRLLRYVCCQVAKLSHTPGGEVCCQLANDRPICDDCVGDGKCKIGRESEREGESEQKIVIYKHTDESAFSR